MNRKQSLLWLMSLLMLAVAPVFTACSDGTDDDKNDPNVIKAGENDPLGEPIGLVYTDFITANDVVHNADTTELTISKALADKKGITNFVNRPMGIWDDKEHAAYLRRATEQRLVDDHYVLKVVRSSIGEVMHGREATLNTGLYYNPERAKSRILTRAADGSTEADKYIDDENIIHPAAITVQRKTDDGSNGVRSTRGVTRGDGNSATYTVEELFTGQPSGANGWFDWLEDAWNEIVEATSYDWDDDKTISLIHTNTTISKNFNFPCGDRDGDSLSLKFKCPVEFDLDYTLNIRSHGSIETAFVPIPSYLETYIDGYFEASPQLIIGFSKALSLPEDKQRITLFQFSGIGFTFMIGPVPLTIDLDPSIYLKFTSTLKGGASFGVRYDIATKFKAGVKYDGNKWSGIADGEKVKDMFSFINPKMSFGYSGSAGIYFGVDVIIEKVAGPSFNIGPQVMVDAELSYQVGDDRMKAEIEAKAGIGGEAGAKIKIFGFNVAEWESSFDIGPQWTIFKYPDDGSGSSGNYDPDNGGGGSAHAGTGDLSGVTSDYVAQNGETLTGTLGSTVKVSIADGATVTLDNVTINGWYDHDDGKRSNLWAGITCNGDATIILQGTNSVKGFNGDYPGIYVPEGKTLTILGNGSFNVSSNGYAAGIGGGVSLACGNIVIKDGNIDATGGIEAAGIGGGGRASCGSITISGGTINATGGSFAPGIGGGAKAGCGNITITSGVTSVTATKGWYAPYSIGIGNGGWGGTVTIGVFVVGNISTSPYTYPDSGPFTGNLSKLIHNYEAKSGDVLTGTLGSNVKISVADGATVTLDGVSINGTNDPNCPWAGITCQGNATLILKGANTVKGFAKNYPGIHIPKGKTLTIRGDGSLAATSNDYGAGIGGGYEMDCGNIVVESGTVKATGSSYAAGIGSGYTAACGNITLKGGTIEATGGSSSAGIGSAFQGSCGNITITNGVTEVTATAGSKCPNSIGAGASGSCGTVTIDGSITGNITTSPFTYTPGSGDQTGTIDLSTLTSDIAAKNGDAITGTLSRDVKISIKDGATVTLDGVTINGTSDYDYKWAGITCLGDATIILKGTNSVRGFCQEFPGIYVPQGKTLTIKGDGSLSASSNGYGAGIGSGYKLACGNIVISGGTISATGGDEAAGIGSGHANSCGNITINGGTVTASGGSGATGIGSGYSKSSCGDITIKGGTINATGGLSAAGIGAGMASSCGNITITNTVTSVTATKGKSAPHSIGKSVQGTIGTVTIGGNVGAISQSPYTYKP